MDFRNVFAIIIETPHRVTSLFFNLSTFIHDLLMPFSFHSIDSLLGIGIHIILTAVEHVQGSINNILKCVNFYCSIIALLVYISGANKIIAQ